MVCFVVVVAIVLVIGDVVWEVDLVGLSKAHPLNDTSNTRERIIDKALILNVINWILMYFVLKVNSLKVKNKGSRTCSIWLFYVRL